MTEIKFRVWDYKNSTMLFPNPIAFTHANRVRVSANEVGIIGKDYDVMQYIGMEDSQGIPIYESDIVDIIWLDEPVDSENRDWLNCEIVWCDCGFRIEYDGVAYDPHHEMYSDGTTLCDIWADPDTLRVTVKGNVYENNKEG